MRRDDKDIWRKVAAKDQIYKAIWRLDWGSLEHDEFVDARMLQAICNATLPGGDWVHVETVKGK